MATAASLSKFKQRSFETSRNDHIPSLSSLTTAPTVVLLGNSILERMCTTGQWKSPDLWPSEAMMNRVNMSATEEDVPRPTKEGVDPLRRISGVFNAGCGGDTIENVLYRLVGDQSHGEPEKNLIGLADALSVHDNKVQLWIVHVGTNDLHKKKGLTDKSVLAMRVLLTTLFEISGPQTHILVSGIFYRTDIRRELVDQGNEKLKRLVSELSDVNGVLAQHKGGQPGTDMDERQDSGQSTTEEVQNNIMGDTAIDTENPSPRIEFLCGSDNIDPDQHLDDHVHLNLHGYQIWTKTLLPKANELLARAQLSCHAAQSMVERSSSNNT